MGRPRREIYSEQVYEICMRTREGLPFVYALYMIFLLKSIIARVQRDQKVIAHHCLWMINHPHILVTAKDKKACTQFYGEVQKQLTDAIKKLTGKKYLNLWKSNGTSVIPYYDLPTLEHRIAYFYANPAQANLVDTISDYPGFSTWKIFNKDFENVDVKHVENCPWVRLPMIEALPNLKVSKLTDRKITDKWRKEATESHELVFEPNSWMKYFGIESKEEVRACNERIIIMLRGMEQEAREVRKATKRGILGKKNLKEQAINLTWQSGKEFRRIFVYSLDKELRMYLIEKYKEFCKECKECYRQWKLGNYSVQWPPGALFPLAPHRSNDYPPEIALFGV